MVILIGELVTQVPLLLKQCLLAKGEIKLIRVERFFWHRLAYVGERSPGVLFFRKSALG